MFFYRYRVVETHLNKYAAWLYNIFLSGKSEKVATSGRDLHIHKVLDKSAGEWVYFAIQKAKEVIGFCSLTKIPRWKGLETSMLYVNPLARGKGIASIIYDAVMKDGVIVISGYSHNPKSRSLWLKMVQNPKYVTWAHDIINLNRYAPIYVENGKFECELKLYEDIKKRRRLRRQDIRIIAYNPKYLT